MKLANMANLDKIYCLNKNKKKKENGTCRHCFFFYFQMGCVVRDILVCGYRNITTENYPPPSNLSNYYRP